MKVVIWRLSLFSLRFVVVVLCSFAFLKKARRAWGIHAKGGACLVHVLSPRLENTQKLMSVQRCLLFLIYRWSREPLNCDLATASCSFEPHNSVLIEANLNLHYLNETICRNDSLIVVNCYKSNSLEQLILVPHFAQIPTHYLGHICLACTLLCRSRDLIRKSAGGRTGEHKWNAGVFVSV